MNDDKKKVRLDNELGNKDRKIMKKKERREYKRSLCTSAITFETKFMKLKNVEIGKSKNGAQVVYDVS